MTAYYVIKPVRDLLILQSGMAELRIYASAVAACAFLVVIPIYSALASRVNRVRLVNGVTAFFASHLVIFYFLGAGKAAIGVAFFVWTGSFNLMLVAQFWAFASDLYTQEQGRRLFAIIGTGSSLGAVFGAAAAGRLFRLLDANHMMLVAAGLLLACMALTNCVHRREPHTGSEARLPKAFDSGSGFPLILKQRYLRLIAVLIVISNVVNTNGEFILSKSVIEKAHAVAYASGHLLTQQEYIGQFYADFYFWVNLVGAILQMFAVSRIFKHIGISAALLVLPIVALGGYTMLSFAPLLSVIRLAKIAENGADYSIQNTARHALFLRTAREAKYKGTTAIDSFFWRLGDAISAGIVFVGASLSFDIRTYATTNAMLTVAWLCIAAAIVWLRISETPQLRRRPLSIS